MDRRREANEAVGDAYYDAWRAGLNPDLVDDERVRDDVMYGGYDRFEAAASEVQRLTDARRAAQRQDAEQQEQERLAQKQEPAPNDGG